MKYKFSLILCGAIMAVLALSFFVSPQVESSELEMRSMTTFSMVLDPIDDIDPNTGEKSILYNADKSIPDRLEDAMKDQIFLRDIIVRGFSSFESKLANLYTGAYSVLKAPFEKDTVPPVTEPPVTGPTSVPDTDSPADTGGPADTDSGKDEATEKQEEPKPIPKDYEKYPIYGYARLEEFSPQKYDYKNIGEFALYNGTDYVSAKPTTWMPYEQEVAAHVEQYERLLSVYPDLKIYHYFVSQICDTPWYSHIMGGYYDKQEYAAQLMPEYVGVKRLTFDNFDDYATYYFKTDHHWNYLGSDQGYLDIYEMLSQDMELSEAANVLKTWNFSKLFGVQYRGSRAKSLGWQYNSYDDFIAFEYDLGERECFAVSPSNIYNEIPVTIGMWEQYKQGRIDQGKYTDHYIAFYGSAFDSNGTKYADESNMLVIKNKDGGEHNILLVGDSTQRALRDPLATHFGTLVTLDYRIIASVPIDEIIERYDIDVILFGGFNFAWSGSPKYLFKFSNSFGG